MHFLWMIYSSLGFTSSIKSACFYALNRVLIKRCISLRSLAFDFVLDKLIEFHLVLVQFIADSQVLGSQIFDLQSDAVQFSLSLLLLPAEVFDHRLHFLQGLFLQSIRGILQILDHDHFFLSIELFLKCLQGAQVFFLGLSLCFPYEILVLLRLEIAVFLVDCAVLLSKFVYCEAMCFLHGVFELFYFL